MNHEFLVSWWMKRALTPPATNQLNSFNPFFENEWVDWIVDCCGGGGINGINQSSFSLWVGYGPAQRPMAPPKEENKEDWLVTPPASFSSINCVDWEENWRGWLGCLLICWLWPLPAAGAPPTKKTNTAKQPTQQPTTLLFSSFFNQINQIHQSPPSWRVRLIGLMVAFFSSFVCWLWAGRSSPAERKKINQFQQLISFLFPWAVNLIEEKRSKDWFIDLLVKDGWLIEVSWMNGLLGPKTHNQQPAIHKENFSFLWNEGAANKLIHSTNSINQN